MSKAKQEVVIEKDQAQVVLDTAKGFWDKYNRIILIAGGVIIVAAAAYIFMSRNKEARSDKAAESIFVAESYYGDALKSPAPDSLYNLALNGDNINKGFLWVIKNYGSTPAGNMAEFYAGDCYYKLKDYANAIKHLKEFSTSSKPIQARAWKMLGDAYSYTGKNNDDALEAYKKAARHFPDDINGSSEYTFVAAYFAHKVLNNKKEATELYKELLSKFPQSRYSSEADKYLAQLGVYTTE